MAGSPPVTTTDGTPRWLTSSTRSGSVMRIFSERSVSHHGQERLHPANLMNVTGLPVFLPSPCSEANTSLRW